MFDTILSSIISIGGIGIIFGLILGYAGEKLKVEEDPKIGQVRDVLPGANCGGCGYAGCDAFAKAIAMGEAPITGCPVGGAKCAEDIANVMGVEPSKEAKKVAYVNCGGDCDKASNKYLYQGMNDCNVSSILAGGGEKTCTYGCLGNGSCVQKCAFDAINIVNGIAVVDPEKCTSCGMCVPACPKKLIDIIPYDSKVQVTCSSRDAGKVVKAGCEVGCIACKICTKQCEFDAIHVENNIAKINYEKCTNCNKCAEKCPTKCISGLKSIAV